MLMLKPLPIDWSAGDARISLNHFHCARRFLHPRTRTYVRLLGPCFKTGRMKPFCHRTYVREMPHDQAQSNEEELKLQTRGSERRQRGTATRHAEISLEMSSARHIQSPASDLPCPWSFPQVRTDVDTRGKKQSARHAQNPLRHLR